KIQSYGLILKSALILGFDNDDLDIFKEQTDFIENAHITCTTINTIKTYPGTPQWLRMQQERRVLDVSEIYWESPKMITNIIPKQMTMRQFLEGYKTVIEHARSWESFERRVKGMVSDVSYVPNTKPIPPEIRMKRANDARAAMTNVPPEVFQTIVNLLQFTM